MAVIAICLEAFLLRNVVNWDYPLSWEYLTSPFHSEILNRSLSIWDEYFGLGFSNLLNSHGAAQYAANYSGAMWLTSNLLNALYQLIGPAYFVHQSVSLFLLIVGVYLILAEFRHISRSVILNITLSVVLAMIIHSTEYAINLVGAGGKQLAGLGLLLITFHQYRRLSRFGFQRIYTVRSLIPLTFCLASLVLIANPSFLGLVMLIGIHWVASFCMAARNKHKTHIHFAKILAVSILLMLMVYGYVIAPIVFSTSNDLMSGVVGRHDSPMQYPLSNLLRFFNNPNSDNFMGVGTWMLFGLSFLGIILAFFSPRMRRWVRVDLICIVIFLLLAKGSAPPFPEVNHWIHVNIPFVRLMGSGYPYFGVIYMLFIYHLIYGAGYAFDVAKKAMPQAGGYVAWSVIIVVVTLAILRNDAYLSGDFGGRVQSIEYPAEYFAFKKLAENKMQIGRTYYFPDSNARIGLDYEYSPTHPIHPMDCCYDLPFSSVFPISIHWSNFEKFSGYYGRTMEFLMKHLDGGNELAEIMAGADTRYLVFDLSLKQSATANSRMMAVRNMVLTSKLFQFQPSLSNRYLEVYENKRWQPASIETKNITLANDDPNVFLSSAKSGSKVSKESIVVSGAVTIAQAMQLKDDNFLKKVALYNSDETGLMLDLIHSKYELKPNSNTLYSDGNLGWFTYNQVYQISDTGKYGGRFIGRNPIASMANGVVADFHAPVLPHVKNMLYIRAMVSPDSGRLWVYVNGTKRLLNLHSKGYVGLQWFDLGDVSVSSGKVKLSVEALDVGYLKRIDVVTIIPLEAIVTSTELMRNLLAEMRVERIEKPDYLQWKMVKQLVDGNGELPQEEMQIAPKKLIVTRHNFSLHEDFDRFDEVPGQEAYNITELHIEKTDPLVRLFNEKNFVRNYGGYNSRFNASADLGNGTYSLKYELSACQAFSELKLDLHTAFVTTERSINIYVSDDASSWIMFATLTSDDRKILDVSELAKGKKKIYLKVSYEKPQVGPTSILLIGLRINGISGDEKMICESHFAKEEHDCSLEKTTLPEKRYGVAHMDQVKISSNFDSVLTNNKAIAVPGIALLNRAYDPNWRMDGVLPFSIDYGFSAFRIEDISKERALKNMWEYKYELLLYVSAGCYLILWIAWVSLGLKRKYWS